MIEVVFHDSALASLRLAQRKEKGPVAAAVGVIISHKDGSEPTAEEIAREQQKAVDAIQKEQDAMIPLGGNPRDVYGFTLYLSTGDISEPIPGPLRAQALSDLWHAYDADMDVTAETNALIENARKTLNTVLERIKQGESMRIWYSDQSDELCGFYWLMSQLHSFGNSLNGQITAIKLPVYDVVSHNETRHYTSCADLSPGDFHRFLPLEQPVSPLMISMYSNVWRNLQAENAPLRAQINGLLRSASIDLYDFYIRQEIAQMPEEFREAHLIGNVLGRHELGISDSFIAQRIESMLRTRELTVVSTPPGTVYRRILRKNY